MKKTVKQLVREGFIVTGNSPDATYIQRGADERVVLSCGMVKRGHRSHRKPQGNGKV